MTQQFLLLKSKGLVYRFQLGPSVTITPHFPFDVERRELVPTGMKSNLGLLGLVFLAVWLLVVLWLRFG